MARLLSIVTIVKLKPSNDDIFVLVNYDGVVC